MNKELQLIAKEEAILAVRSHLDRFDRSTFKAVESAVGRACCRTIDLCATKCDKVAEHAASLGLFDERDRLVQAADAIRALKKE